MFLVGRNHLKTSTMRIDRARQLSERIRFACPQARVLVAVDGGTAAVFVSLANHTARIDRLSDWRDHFVRNDGSGNWFARCQRNSACPQASPIAADASHSQSLQELRRYASPRLTSDRSSTWMHFSRS